MPSNFKTRRDDTKTRLEKATQATVQEKCGRDSLRAYERYIMLNLFAAVEGSPSLDRQVKPGIGLSVRAKYPLVDTKAVVRYVQDSRPHDTNTRSAFHLDICHQDEREERED